MFTRVIGAKPTQASPAGRQQSTSKGPSFLSSRVQPRLTVGPVDDPLEREADRLAERVVSRLPPGPLGLSALAPTFVQRQEDGAEEGDEKEEPEEADEIRLKAAGPPPAEPGGGSVPAGVEAGIRQAQGTGRPLPQPVRGGMEKALGTDLGAVRVHTGDTSDRLNRSLQARAFTTGHDVFFRGGEYRPASREGWRLLAHELTHVVQQGAARPLRDRHLIQRAFAGPQFPLANQQDTKYSGHAFDEGKGMKHTGCGTENSIQTAGEHKNDHDSAPGTPNKLVRYRDDYSVKGGLARDKSLDQTATKMHLINHRLEDSGNTQRNSHNIMMGTQRSNTGHLNDVEQKVINALKHSTRENDAYETAMDDAQKTQDAAAKNVLFWAAKPAKEAVKHAQLEDVYLKQNDVNQGVAAAKTHKSDVQGYGLVVDDNTPGANYRHLWLQYTVTANYGDRPAYVNKNIEREKKWNKKNNKGADKASFNAKITEFDDDWADNAFPPDFDCSVSYFSATYDPWNGIYAEESEEETLDSAR